MMNKSYCLLFTLCCLLLRANSAFSVNNQSSVIGNQLPIGSIQTAGNVSISKVKILSKVRSRVGELFDPVTAAEDARRIAELPGVEHSYYNTVVIDDKIQLTFVVVERNIVRSIDFVGSRKYKAKTLRRKLTFKVGDYLDSILAETCRKTLVEFYRKKGFAFIQVELDAEQLREGKVIYTVDEGPRVKIDSVNFSGNSAVKTKTLRKAIKTKTKKWFLLPSYYVEETLVGDLTRLQNIYQRRGFLNASITAKREFSPDNRKVGFTFVIDEGAAYTVERIVIIGNEQFDKSRLQAELKLKQGQIHSEQRAGLDVKRLLKLYRENGFIDAEVGHSVRFVSENSVNVEFEVAEGERFRIGRINITGNEQTQDKVVRRVLDEYDFQPGQWYNADMARGDASGSGYLEKLIRRTTYTKAAHITPTGEVPGQRDAEVSIIEGQTGNVMVGAGVYTDRGIIGQLVVEQRNFDINDWPESFYEFITGQAFKGAGQHLRIALSPGTEVSEYSISFTEPYFKNKPISLDVVGLSREWERESYDENRLRGYVGFEKRYKNRWRRSISFRLEDVDVDGIDSDAPKEIRDDKGANALAGVKLGAGRDTRDDRFNPSKGYSFDVSYEQVGGDHTFGILSGVHRRYRTVYEDLAGRKIILATKLLGATVVGNAPPFEKFYGGGSGFYGIRGFDFRGVSTRGTPTTVDGVPIAGRKRKDPIGSDWIFLANAEVSVPLVGENFAALFFVDSGAVDSGGYRAAVGTGIQILIPQWFGPVPMRFELATPLMKDGEDDTQVFSFSIGRLF
jgi:outer membrane protein insertion porin family